MTENVLRLAMACKLFVSLTNVSQLVMG